MKGGIALEGRYAGLPSSFERCAEILGHHPTQAEHRHFRKLRQNLGSDPTKEELDLFLQFKKSRASKGKALLAAKEGTL